MSDGFWAFSLALYESPAVQRACLALQDAHGADVNVALYLLWRATQGERFDARGVAAIDAAVAPWREEAVRPLRAIRRRLKETSFIEPDAQEAFRNKLKKVELDAEKLEQVTLEQLQVPAGGSGEVPDCARANLRSYAAFLESVFPEAIVDTFVTRLGSLD